MHVCCMLERAEHLATEPVDPRSCVACHAEWAGGTLTSSNRRSLKQGCQ